MAKKKVLSIAEQEWAKYQKNEMGMNPNPLRSVEVVEATDEEKKKGKKKAKAMRPKKGMKSMGKKRRGKRSSSTTPGSGAQDDAGVNPTALANRKKQQQIADDAAKKAAADKAAADKAAADKKKDEPKKDEPNYTPAYIAWAKKNNMEAGAAGAQARYKAATGKGAIAAPASNGKKDPGKETITPTKK